MLKEQLDEGVAARQDMIGRCYHVTLRFRIFLLLLTVVLLYTVTWLFNYRSVSYHGKTFLDSSDDVLRIARNHTLGKSNRDTSEYIRPIFINMSNKGKHKNILTKVVTGNKTYQTGTYKSLIHDKESTNDRFVNINADNHDKKILNQISHEESLSVIENTKTGNIDLDENAKGKLTTIKRNDLNVGKPDLLRDMDRHQSQNRTHHNLIQLSLDYKPNIARGSSKVFHLISPNKNKSEQTRLVQFEPNMETRKVSLLTNNKSNLNKELLLKESSHDLKTDALNKNLVGDYHVNDTILFVNKTELDSSKVANTTTNSSFEKTFEKDTFASCKYPFRVSNKIKVGILIPSSTRKIESPTLQNLSLIKTSLPSIYDTLEERYIYRIYIGIDDGDFLQTVQEELQKMFDCVIPVIVQRKNYVKSVNTIADRAYKDGMDYLVRTNDDTFFVTQNWTSIGINKLREYHPENVGVVGPTCKEGNTGILTHDMVHRKHLEIFDFYYPPYLENWWTDDWITHVYEPKKSTKLSSWVVKHIMLHTRYTVDFERQKWANTLIKYDKTRLQNYIGCTCEKCESSANNLTKHVSVVTTLLPYFILLFLEFL